MKRQTALDLSHNDTGSHLAHASLPRSLRQSSPRAGGYAATQLEAEA